MIVSAVTFLPVTPVKPVTRSQAKEPLLDPLPSDRVEAAQSRPDRQKNGRNAPRSAASRSSRAVQAALLDLPRGG